jgi:zinc transporter 5/7
MARFWPKDSETVVGSIHIQISTQILDRSQNYAENRTEIIAERIEELLRRKISGLRDVTVQVEIAHRTPET